MRKVVIGLFVAVIVGAAGYFGFVYWAERTAAREVDAVLERWRAGGGTAARGRLRFDLWTRTVKVADVVLQSASPRDEEITIAEVIASGVNASGGARRVELFDLEISHTLPGLGGGARLQQKAPRVTLTDFSERPVARGKRGSALDAIRMWLEKFSAITAASIEIPSLNVTIAPAANSNRPHALGTAEYTYSNLVLRDVRNGRIAEATVDGIAVRGSTGGTSGPLRQPFSGEMAKVSMRDIDMGPVLAFLDPSRPGRDRAGEDYQRVYGQLSAGQYTVRFGAGNSMTIDRLVAEEIGLRPAKMSLDDFTFLIEVSKPANTVLMPGQLSMLADKMAGLYEGVHLGKLEMHGLRFDTPRDSIKVASLAINGFDNGRLAEMSIERLQGQVPPGQALARRAPTRGPLSIGRMSLKGFHIANLLRTASTQLASVGLRAGGPNPLLAMLGLIEGLELRDFEVADPKTGRVIHLEAFDASWGRIVGGIPSEARLSAKLSGPISATDREAFIRALAARGVSNLAASFDLGVRWQEAERNVVLAPASLEIRDVLALSVKASVGNVRREMLSTDMIKVLSGVPLVEAGPIEVTVRDLGAVDAAAAEAGQAKGGDAEAGRALLLESLAQKSAAAMQANPELQPFFDALGRFLQGKGETLTITLTPKGSVGLLQLIDAARRDAVGTLLANFTVEARTGG